MKQFLKLLLMAFICAGLIVSSNGHVAAASVNDFVISDYHITYLLSRNKDGHSVLRTTETITALFPQTDQNHGLERAIPNQYDKRTTSLHIDSVTDKTGNDMRYQSRTANGNTVLRIGNPNLYVHGSQTYVITYQQQNVSRYFGDTKADEFYWDTNGTGWPVAINNLHVKLTIDPSLQPSLSGAADCYIGTVGSTQHCSISQSGTSFTTQSSGLKPYENISLAIGFKPTTFAAYTPSTADRVQSIVPILMIATFPVGLLLAAWFLIRYRRQSNRSAEHTTIVPEYVPPSDTSVTLSAAIYRRASGTFAAQLIDFAVRGYVKIYETKSKSLWHKARYELEITADIANLHDEEREILQDIFPSTAVGSRIDLTELTKNSTVLYTKLRDNRGKLDTNIVGKYSLRVKDPAKRGWFKRAGLICLIVGIVLLSPWILAAAIVAFICSFVLYPLSDRGLSLYHYLEGLKLYIKTAETDRIRMLQGPDSAEKIGAPIDTNDTKQLIKLYERVLPYAILFGLETGWNKQLGLYYQSADQAPDWYNGNSTMFNAALFSTMVSDFNTAAIYASPSSSSSGGSGGGGFSGGGGGGGGGGGW